MYVCYPLDCLCNYLFLSYSLWPVCHCCGTSNHILSAYILKHSHIRHIQWNLICPISHHHSNRLKLFLPKLSKIRRLNHNFHRKIQFLIGNYYRYFGRCRFLHCIFFPSTFHFIPHTAVYRQSEIFTIIRQQILFASLIQLILEISHQFNSKYLQWICVLYLSYSTAIN